MDFRALEKVRRLFNLNIATVVLFTGSLVSVQLLTMAVTDAGPNTTTYPLTSGYGGGEYITTATDGSMWYAEGDSTGSYDLAHITTSGTITDYSATPSGYTGITHVGGIAIDSSGNVWFDGIVYGGSPAGALLMELNTSTGTITVATPLNVGAGFETGPIVIDGAGNIWVTDNSEWDPPSSSYLVRFTSSGVRSYTRATSVGSSGPANWTDMIVGSDGALWLTDAANNAVDKITLSSGTDNVSSVDVYMTPTTGSEPAGIALGPDGSLWVAEDGVDKIGEVTTAGVFTEYSVPSGTEPTGITSGSDGALWFTGLANNTIGRITISGSVAEYSLASSGFTLPISITTGGDGAIWFNEEGVSKIGLLKADYLSRLVATSAKIC